MTGVFPGNGLDKSRPNFIFAGNFVFPAEGLPPWCARWPFHASVAVLDMVMIDIANDTVTLLPPPILLPGLLGIFKPYLATAIVHAERPGLWPLGSRAGGYDLELFPVLGLWLNH
ncbi:uncharacterized protein ATNIH1004_002762 [Aspergillus tanneri]|uniref:Uncharacterized protein n=1 Tax=Aspergillus tanneri TaxID=1220188 RepID=A0A5M9MSH9_9EURO|nr:uncharacterized protein ATNIH1004_002762 [Aspergillus tanneri]KAA8650081.1 hypothetical protein ATNIH1004_002762 [Aspergillus tanneri]